MSQYDLVVIGAGPGGYVCAIKAAQLGLKVACVEKRSTLGGTCLNVGCIPSKALLHASEVFEQASHVMSKIGVKTSGVELDLGQMMAHKDETVSTLTKGIAGLLKKNKIDTVYGTAKITSANTVEVALNDGGSQVLNTKNIVIATGSDVAQIPNVTIDEQTIVSSTGALSLSKVPNHLVVVGGGVIGLEMGSVWARLGAKVTVVEFADKIVPSMDFELGKQFQRTLEKQGMTFQLSTKVTSAEKTENGVKLSVEAVDGSKKETLDADVVLVSIGRIPYTTGLGLEAVGVALDNRGRINVDHHLETNVKGIYAIGDVIVGPMLAHKAEEEGVAIAERLAGGAGHVNYDVIPSVVYTWPEVASVGQTEEEIKQAGIQYKVGKFPFMANARAKATLNTDGFVKIITNAQTDRILGVHIIGPNAGHLIAEAAMAIEFNASAEDLARTCHAHPTLSEVVKEAALAAFSKAIHV